MSLKFQSKFSGTAVTFMQSDINTDRIMPGEWMMRVHSEGFSAGLFADERYREDGSDEPSFVLNRLPWRSASILIAGANFGCGSTREEAPRALREFGFRCIIAPSFPAVFFANCFRNGIIAISLESRLVDELADVTKDTGGTALISVDLNQQIVSLMPDKHIEFQTPYKLRRMLIEGTDEIGVTLLQKSEIEKFRNTDRAYRPWAYIGGKFETS